MADICSYYSYSHYITESERLTLDEKYAELFVEASAIINCRELEEYPQKESFKRFHKAMSDTKGHKLASHTKEHGHNSLIIFVRSQIVTMEDEDQNKWN